MNTIYKVLVVFAFLVACKPVEKNASISPQSAPKEVPIESTSNEPECRLSVGFDVWEPYQYVDVNSEVMGLDIELVSALYTKRR